MCDRTKSEVLARELCIEFKSGNSVKLIETNLKEFVERDWIDWEVTAKRILVALEKHKE